MSGATNLIPEVSFRVNENLIGSSRRNLSLALLDRRKAQTIVRTSAAKTGRGQGAAPISKSVLISGIGIAGPTLAYWLSAWGYRPTLTERAAAPRTDGYIIDFWGLGYDIAERMGLLPALREQGYHVRERRFVDDRGRRMSGFGVDVFRALTGVRYVSASRKLPGGLPGRSRQIRGLACSFAIR